MMKANYGRSITGVIITVLFISAVCFIIPANAMNLDYLSVAKWDNNDKVTRELITLCDMENTYDGELAYYADGSDMCLYTCFSVDGDFSGVMIAYYVHTPDEEYAFAVDESGIVDDDNDEEPRVFDARANYSYSYDGKYLSAIQYKGKDRSITVDVDFYANGKVCYRKQGLVLEIPETTKPEKTTKPSGRENGKTTESADSKSTTKSSRQPSAPTTKYRPTGYAGESETHKEKVRSGKKQKADADDADGEIYEEPTQQGDTAKAAAEKPQLNTFAKVMLGAGSASVFAGVAAVAYAALKKDKRKKQQAAEKTE